MTHFPAIADALSAKRANPSPAKPLDVTAYFFDNGQTASQKAQRQISATNHALNGLSNYYTPYALQILKYLSQNKLLDFQAKHIMSNLGLTQPNVSTPLKVLLNAGLITRTNKHGYTRYTYQTGALKALQTHIDNKRTNQEQA